MSYILPVKEGSVVFCLGYNGIHNNVDTYIKAL